MIIFNNDDFNKFFDFDTDFYSFKRDEKDMHPCSTIEKDGKQIIVHNIVGINKEDLKLTLKKENHFNYIYIEGKSKDDVTGKEYIINSRIQLKQDKIKKITSYTKNGLLYMTLEYEDMKNESQEIKVD